MATHGKKTILHQHGRTVLLYNCHRNDKSSAVSSKSEAVPNWAKLKSRLTDSSSKVTRTSNTNKKSSAFLVLPEGVQANFTSNNDNDDITSPFSITPQKSDEWLKLWQLLWTANDKRKKTGKDPLCEDMCVLVSVVIFKYKYPDIQTSQYQCGLCRSN